MYERFNNLHVITEWGERAALITSVNLGSPVIEFFNNSGATLNFEHIAMHCGLSRVWKRTVIFIILNNRQMLGITNKTKKP